MTGGRGSWRWGALTLDRRANKADARSNATVSVTCRMRGHGQGTCVRVGALGEVGTCVGQEGRGVLCSCDM